MNVEGGWKEALGSEMDNPERPRRSGFPVVIYTRCVVCGGTGSMGEGIPCKECNGTGNSSEAESEWMVSSCEMRIKAQFEEWVQNNAIRLCDKIEATRGSEHAAQFRSNFEGDYAGGMYFWDGRHCRNARQDMPGMRYLFYLLLRRCHPEVTPDLAGEVMTKNPGGCAAAIGWAMGNSSSPLTQPSGVEGGKAGKRVPSMPVVES